MKSSMHLRRHPIILHPPSSSFPSSPLTPIAPVAVGIARPTLVNQGGKRNSLYSLDRYMPSAMASGSLLDLPLPDDEAVLGPIIEDPEEEDEA